MEQEKTDRPIPYSQFVRHGLLSGGLQGIQQGIQGIQEPITGPIISYREGKESTFFKPKISFENEEQIHSLSKEELIERLNKIHNDMKDFFQEEKTDTKNIEANSRLRR